MGHVRTHLIGIAGGSSSGKTALAHAVAAQLTTDSAPVVPVVPLDAYYRQAPPAPPGARAAHNFDTPDALDHDLIVTHLRQLAAGQGIDRPVYDFASHSRLDETARIPAGPFVVVEGLLSLHWEATRERFGTRVFVTTDDAVCLARRVARDVHERGRTKASIRAQWEATVWPMFNRYVRPTRAFADLVVSGSRPLDENAARVVAHAHRMARPT